MRKQILLFLLSYSSLYGQIVEHPTLGLEPWFGSWYQESKQQSKKTKINNATDKDVINLYLTIVNGTTGGSGGVEGVSRAVFPAGRYSVVGESLSYVVIPAFPKEMPSELGGLSIDWSGLYDKYLYNDSIPKRTWDSFALDPKSYRVPGLVLTTKRMQDLAAYLEKDAKAESNRTGMYPDRPVRGESWRRVGEWINLLEPHWGNRWIFRSFPSVSGILIDKKRTQAVVKYGIHNGGGIARYRKEGKIWVLVESRINILQ